MWISIGHDIKLSGSLSLNQFSDVLVIIKYSLTYFQVKIHIKLSVV